jgi:hypothetical protein
MDSSPETLADDILEGARAIAGFCYGEPVTSDKLRLTYYRIERGYLKVGRIGNKLIASRLSLREQHARLTGAA